MSVFAITTCTSCNRQTYTYPDPKGLRSGNFQERGTFSDLLAAQQNSVPKPVVSASENDPVRPLHLVPVEPVPEHLIDEQRTKNHGGEIIRHHGPYCPENPDGLTCLGVT